MAKITKRSVDALEPTNRAVLLWDEEIPGFGVRVPPSGRKVYCLKYRTAAGRQRWLTLGRHGPMAPAQAREMALQYKAVIAQGADPSGDRQKRRREKTMSDVADRYLTEHVAAHNKASTAKEAGRIVQTRIKPALGHIRITDLTRADVKAWHQALAAVPYEANRALAYLSKMLSLAATDWELRPDNPSHGIKRFPEHKRDRFYNDEELKRVGEALVQIESEGREPPGFVLLVKLLATTGMRLGEALALSWSDVDLQHRIVTLRDAKTGTRTVHLSGETIALLGNLPYRDGWVVRGLDRVSPLSANSAEKSWQRLRERAGISNARIHDLRHTVGTYAAMNGSNAFMVRDLLGHKTLAMTGRYVERAAEMVRATADAVSSRVAAALNAGSSPPTEVLKQPQHR
jgi:integrase